jgi:glycosyltransferase involved in cell wall biosynthesis
LELVLNAQLPSWKFITIQYICNTAGKLTKKFMNGFDSSSTHICCISNGWFPDTPGGLERYVYELTHHLSKKQDKIELFGADLPETHVNSSIKLTTLGEATSPFLKGLWFAYQNFQNRKIIRPDAFNFHFAYYALPLLTSLPPKVPLTFTFHGPWASEAQQEGLSARHVRLMYWIERYVYRKCDRFIVLSKAFGTILHEQYKVPWQKIHIIPGGVDTERFQLNLSRKQAREQLNWPPDRPILFAPRRLCHRMGLNKLLMALAQVKFQIPDIWLVIAGKGLLRDTLELQVQEFELENHVQFIGYLPEEELSIAYQAANLTVVPSQTLEGFGLVLVESLACGTPVVCTPIGGMPEVVGSLCPHLIAQSADENGIAERVIQLLTGKLELPSRDSCREYAVRNFDWQVIIPRVREVLLL